LQEAAFVNGCPPYFQSDTWLLLHQFDIDFAGRIHQADLDHRHIEAPGDQQLGLRESARARPKLMRNGARLDVFI